MVKKKYYQTIVYYRKVNGTQKSVVFNGKFTAIRALKKILGQEKEIVNIEKMDYICDIYCMSDKDFKEKAVLAGGN